MEGEFFMKKSMQMVVAVVAILGTAATYSPSFAAEKPATVVAQSDYAAHPLKNSIDYVLKNRLMWTFPDGSFRPEQVVTQAELVTSLVTIKGVKKAAPVPEIAAGHWAKAAYEKAKADGMLDGVTIRPYAVLTREEAAYLVINAMQSVRNSRGLKNNENYYKNLPNIQFVVGYRWIPKKAGKFPNGVSTTAYDGLSNYTRAEQAFTINQLHVDLNEMAQANKLADEFHTSLKVKSGVISGKAVTGTNQVNTDITILYKDGKFKIIKTDNSVFREDVKKVARVIFGTVTPYRKGLVEYRYDSFDPPLRERRWY
ncbi:S-layer homology domain-containing protein [Brevibacillus fluminis]|uniref:S-layer homology domain-containing protein n=2 Tax=Brevibacillus fluminis TaxID=511487 RepID=A0A3M8D325_9BACL|nr:S-layer homology domain-containing protein [Brevibacillus fluminis]